MKNKGIIKLNILTLSFLLLISLIMPFNIIYGDSTPTYVQLNNELFNIFTSDVNDISKFKSSDDVRLVAFSSSNNGTSRDIFIYCISLNSGSSYTTADDVVHNITNTRSYNNIQYYYQLSTFGSYRDILNEPPYINYSTQSSTTRADMAFRYTFGDLAVDPETSVNYGSLNIGYSTKFVTTNFEGFNDENIDTITWSDTDSNGNFLNGLNTNIEIRAVPNYYVADSSANLLNQTISNLILGVAAWTSDGAVNISPQTNYQVYKGSINRKKLSIKWSDVISSFPNDWLKQGLSDVIQDNINSKYYKTGWIYQVRYLVNEGESDEFISDWQTVYQVTSAPPETTTTIVQQIPNGLSPELYNMLQTINTLNNTVQNWNINGVPINMQPTQTTDNNKPWYEVLLESITSMINTIIEAITGLGGDLINGLFDLVNGLGVNVLDFFTNLWNGLTDMFNDIDIENNEDFSFEIPDNADLLSLPKLTYNLFVNSGFAFILLIPLVFILIGVIL